MSNYSTRIVWNSLPPRLNTCALFARFFIPLVFFLFLLTCLHIRFRDTEYHLAFLNLPLFLRTLWHPEDRVRSIRPVFILAAMAMATLMKSSEFEGGLMGRDKALWYRNEAEKAMEQSYASGERSVGMAQAALVSATSRFIECSDVLTQTRS